MTGRFPFESRGSRSLVTYHPHDTPAYYLEAAVVETVARAVGAGTVADRAVLELIVTHETVHREEALGDRQRGCAESVFGAKRQEYIDIHGRDPIETSVYRRFYDLVNGMDT